MLCGRTGQVPPLWCPGGPWDDLGTPGSTKKDTLRSRLVFLLIFDGFRESILKAFWEPWTKKGVFVFACLQFVSFDDFLHRKPDVLVWKTKHDRCCRNQLSQQSDFSWFQNQFFMILAGLEANFYDFVCPWDCPEIWWLFKVILGPSQILRPSWLRLICSFQGPSNNNSWIPETD